MVKKIKSATESLEGKWGLAIGGFFLYIVILLAASVVADAIDSTGAIGTIVSLIISGPFLVGLSIFYLSIVRDKKAKIEQIFEGFNYFLTSLVTHLLSTLFILFGMIFLIIPGIIISLSLSMSYFIIADNRKIRATDALKKSRKIMQGHKWSLFCLGLKFMLLAICCIFTLGIGFIFLLPYIYVSLANFYERIK